MTRESQNIVNLKACRSIKELALTAQETIGVLENALYQILDANRLDVAKEIASEVLEEDLESYLEDEVPELDFEADSSFGNEGLDLGFEDRE